MSPLLWQPLEWVLQFKPSEMSDQEMVVSVTLYQVSILESTPQEIELWSMTTLETEPPLLAIW